MDNTTLFLKITEERFHRYLDNYTQDNGDFLTPEEQSILMPFIRKNASNGAFLYGGYDEAERRLALFMPDYTGVETENDLYSYFANNPDESPIVVLNVTVPKLGELRARPPRLPTGRLWVSALSAKKSETSSFRAGLRAVRQAAHPNLTETQPPGRK